MQPSPGSAAPARSDRRSTWVKRLAAPPARHRAATLNRRPDLGPAGRLLESTDAPWADRVQLIPVFGAVSAPAALLIRPDGHSPGLEAARTTGFPRRWRPGSERRLRR